MRTVVTVLTAVVLAAGAGFYGIGQAQEQNRQRVGEGVAGQLQERIQDLNLTDAQEARIASIRKEYQPKVEAAAKELAAAVKDEVQKARAVLTPEQQTKVQALKEERKEHRIGGLAARFAHLQQLDLTDGEIAKIQEIRKEYRPKIEAALKNMEGLLTAEQRKARQEALKAGKNHREVLAALNLNDDQKAKVENVCKEVGTLVRQEMEKIRDVLTEEQQAKLAEFAQERKDHIRDRMAAAIVNFKDLNLTDDQKAKLRDIRQEFRPKVHEAGNKFRAVVREEVAAIVNVIKG
jgi:Spy/CpxP family protein refolding chaperone